MICHKNFLRNWHFNVVVSYNFPCDLCHPVWIFSPSASLPIKLNEHFFTLPSKIVTHFWDRGGRVCFSAHPVIALIIFARQNYFHQIFYLKKTFPIWYFKIVPRIPPRGDGRSSIFESTDDFLKTLNACFCCCCCCCFLFVCFLLLLFCFVLVFCCCFVLFCFFVVCFSIQGVFFKMFGKFDFFFCCYTRYV